MRTYLLVDGHSVLFSWPELRALHEKKTSLARQELTRLLQRLHDISSWRVTLVFDGRLGSSPLRGENEMVVAYSGADETADSVIERLVGSKGLAKHILVITADEVEKRTVEAHGAETASPEWLREELALHETQFQETLQEVKKKAAR